MAESDKKSGGGSIPWVNVTALLVAVAGGLSAFLEPLISSRPQRGSTPVEIRGEQDVDARLWQDPLRVATEHFEKRTGTDQANELGRREKHLSGLRQEIAEERNDASSLRLLILPVLIPSGPYAENNERRLRTRQAVVSGLAVSGYAPDDGERIGYFLWPQPDPAMAGTEPAALLSGNVVPYEWFHPRYGDSKLADPRKFERILILWARDDLPGTETLSTLRELGRALNWNPRTEKISVLGPGTSTSLTGLLKKDREMASAGESSGLGGVDLYAAMPTASDAVIALSLKKEDASSVRNLRSGPTLRRTINTDDQVAEAIIAELKSREVDLRRNLKPGQDSSSLQHIAIISEWDTIYGRALPLTLLARIYRQDSKEGLRGFMEGKGGNLESGSHPEWFHTFSYLRGIDGRLPAEGAPAKSVAPAGKDSSTPAPREATEGEDQSDYLRRLARQLAAKDQELKRNGGDGLRAVGILGSDVYDKLMILRALRKELPGAIFFTNNLDARLGLQEEWPATHNLIVVSPFGLSLDRPYQRNIPPFRDSYQTSIFASTLLITGVLQSLDNLSPPRVFEIARDGPWDLSHQSTSFPARDLDPRRLDVLPWWGFARRYLAGAVAFLGFAALLIWIALTAGWVGLGTSDAPYWRFKDVAGELFGKTAVAAVLAGFFGIVVIWPIYYCQRLDGEPLAFLQGISIWPTEMVRIAVIVLCAHFVWKSSLALRRSNHKIKEEHCLSGQEKRSGSEDGSPIRRVIAEMRWEISEIYRRLKTGAVGWRTESRALPPERTQGEEPRPPTPKHRRRVNAEKLWQEYLDLGRWSRRLIRFGPLVLFYLVGGIALIVLLGRPVVPARGWVSFTVDKALLFFCIVCTTTLLFYVVDAIRLNRDLIELFNQGITVWPESARDLNARNRVLSAEELSEYLDIRLIAARTEVVCPLVNYPFVVLVLLIVARNSYFDNWDWPWSLIVIFVLNLGWAIYCSLQLYRAAGKARRTALDRLSDHRLEALHLAGTAPTPEQRKAAKMKMKMIDETLGEIRDLRRGAFAPLSDQPFFRAMLFASGSIGIGSLVQYLPNLF